MISSSILKISANKFYSKNKIVNSFLSKLISYWDKTDQSIYKWLIKKEWDRVLIEYKGKSILKSDVLSFYLKDNMKNLNTLFSSIKNKRISIIKSTYKNSFMWKRNLDENKSPISVSKLDFYNDLKSNENLAFWILQSVIEFHILYEKEVDEIVLDIDNIEGKDGIYSKEKFIKMVKLISYYLNKSDLNIKSINIRESSPTAKKSGAYITIKFNKKVDINITREKIKTYLNNIDELYKNNIMVNKIRSPFSYILIDFSTTFYNKNISANGSFKISMALDKEAYNLIGK